VAAGAAVGVAGGGLLQVDAGDVGDADQPGEGVAELVLERGRVALAERLGDLADLLDPPAEGAIHAPGAVARPEGRLDPCLQVAELHAAGHPPVEAGVLPRRISGLMAPTIAPASPTANSVVFRSGPSGHTTQEGVAPELRGWGGGQGMRLAKTSDAPDEECTIQDLVELIGQQQRVLQDALSRHHIGKPRRETARASVLAAVLYRLDTLSRLLRWSVRPIDPCLRNDLGQLLERVGGLVCDARENPFMQLSHREAAWELVLELDCALLEVGDTHYLLDRLEQERQLDNSKEAENRWSDLYDSDHLRELQDDLASESPTPDGPNRVVEMLARLLQARSDTDRAYRAQETLRVVRLRWTNWVLSGALVLGMVLFGFLLFDNWEHRLLSVGLVLAPAALGGTLSRIRTLRDEPLVSRSGEQPRYRAAFVAQLLVSGALGLILLGLAAMDFLPGLEPGQGENPGDPLGQNVFEGNNPLIFAFYAFLAGYSEPWTFNILQRALPAGGAI